MFFFFLFNEEGFANPKGEAGRETAIIETAYTCFLEDDYPLLYTGKNSLDGWVIGSFLQESEDDLTILHYLHFAVKEVDYEAFISRRISYHDIFSLYKTAYRIDRDLATLKEVRVMPVATAAIPPEFFPHPESYFPITKKEETTLSYKVRITGGVADRNQALSKDVSQIEIAFSEILEGVLESLPDLGLDAVVYQTPPTKGSFLLNFNVELENYKKNLFWDKTKLATFQNHLIEYCFNNLPAAVDSIYQSGEPIGLEGLLGEAKEIYRMLGRPTPSDENLIEAIKEAFLLTATGFSKAVAAVGSGYTALQLYTDTVEHKRDVLIGRLDQSSEEVFSEVVDKIEEYTKKPGEEISVDENDSHYNVYIFSLNVESRNGMGIVFGDGGGKVRLKINGKQALEKTVFTKSIDGHIAIDVKGIATRIGDKITRLVIDYDLTSEIA